MHPEATRDLLLRIASQGPVTLADGDVLDQLLKQGLLRRLEAPRSEGLRAQYETLQGKHQRFLEAKTLVDRLQAPRKGLTRWLPGSSGPLPAEELQALHDLLALLGIQVRDCAEPADLPPRLDRVREHLQVEDRDCLDRMGSLDREIGVLEKQGSESVRVDGFGHVALSEEGRRLLPETSVLEELDSVFNLVSGPRRQKITDYEHFRVDPATLLAFVLVNPSRLERTALVDTFESLAQALDRARDLQNLKHRNGLVIRLIRCFREQPKLAHFWCGRERLQELGTPARSLENTGGHFPFAVDLLLAGPGPEDPAHRFEERLRLMESVQSALKAGLGSIYLSDQASLRLALGLLHEALGRNVTGPVLAGRLVQRQLGVCLEAMAEAPLDLGDPAMRLLFGFHIAHWADFQIHRIPALMGSYRAIEAAFLPEGRRKRVSAQILLHTLAVLERLKALGPVVAPEEYAGTFQRILHRLQSHRDLARAFQADPHGGEEEHHLAANLTARAYFSPLSPGARLQPDVGAAGAYEDLSQPTPPLLGKAFGTLFL